MYFMYCAEHVMQQWSRLDCLNLEGWNATSHSAECRRWKDAVDPGFDTALEAQSHKSLN